MIIDAEKQRAFLIELRALTMKYGIQIQGCGCCGSPALEPATITDDRAGYVYDDRLRWIDPSDEYDWERYGAAVVKPRARKGKTT